MHWLTYASIPILIVVLWLYTAQFSKSFPTLRGKRICLLIAHPDDEAMFFAPTVQALTRSELDNKLKILCLSSGPSIVSFSCSRAHFGFTGNADGLGETRKKELTKSAMLLGLEAEEDVFIIDHPDFPDSMNVTWNPRLISNLLTATFAPRMAKIPSTSAPETTIDALITFDQGGVSGHTNHRSLYHGAVTFLKALMHRHTGWECPVALYTLTTASMLRKYASIVDAPATILSLVLSKKEQGPAPSPQLFVSGLEGYSVARKAMVHGHKSQMVWFRWGWVTLSRYMIINDLHKEKI